MYGRPSLGTVYRVGATGARVVYRDGSVARHEPWTLVMFTRHPLKIEGRLSEVGRRGLTYEAPAFVPSEIK